MPSAVRESGYKIKHGQIKYLETSLKKMEIKSVLRNLVIYLQMDFRKQIAFLCVFVPARTLRFVRAGLRGYTGLPASNHKKTAHVIRRR